jgi:hypothetical protein
VTDGSHVASTPSLAQQGRVGEGCFGGFPDKPREPVRPPGSHASYRRVGQAIRRCGDRPRTSPAPA